MAADNITVGSKWATIECDSTKHTVILDNLPKGSLTCTGPNNVFLHQGVSSGDLARDGAQNSGEIELEPGDSVPVPDGATKIENQCLAGQTSKLIFVPLRK